MPTPCFAKHHFLERDREKAANRYHLTARQAGVLGRKAQVQQLMVFHFSPRYTGQGDLIQQEAYEAFTATSQERQRHSA